LDVEELMLQKMKVECGHNTVNKMASMFADIKISKEIMILFQQMALEGVEFTTEILTSGHWPELEQRACTLPPELKAMTM
jgi:Cullin family